MDPSDIPLFDLAAQRLRWIDRRQDVLAQNVANADTPGWRPRDIRPFDQILAGHGGAPPTGDLSRTSPMHLSGIAGGTTGDATGDPTGATTDAVPRRDGERAPDGNAVSLDVELAKVADTEGAHELVTGIYKKYLGLFRTALGK